MGDAHEALWLCGFRCTGSFGLCVALEGVTHLSSPPCPAHTHFLAALCLFTAAASGANVTWSLQEANISLRSHCGYQGPPRAQTGVSSTSSEHP